MFAAADPRSSCESRASVMARRELLRQPARRGMDRKRGRASRHGPRTADQGQADPRDGRERRNGRVRRTSALSLAVPSFKIDLLIVCSDRTAALQSVACDHNLGTAVSPFRTSASSSAGASLALGGSI